VLPSGFHRIRHYGLLASGTRAVNIARARELLAVPISPEPPDATETPTADQARMLPRPCPCCGGRMFIIETFARGCEPKHQPTPVPGSYPRKRHSASILASGLWASRQPGGLKQPIPVGGMHALQCFELLEDRSRNRTIETSALVI
jgi:hypothetical protein